MDNDMKDTMTHMGRKISRLRELRGMKQEILAEQLGISQQAISKIEQSEHVEDITIDRISKALGMTSDALKNFNEEAVFNVISNTFTSHDNSTLNAINYYPTFNPLDEIKKLNSEKEELYKALLKEKDEKIALLERVVEKLNKQ